MDFHKFKIYQFYIRLQSRGFATRTKYSLKGELRPEISLLHMKVLTLIKVFDLRVQLQHCMYQRKTLLFALIKVSTFICKREISGLSSPLISILRYRHEQRHEIEAACQR